MVFSSVEFLLFFLPIFLILYGLTPDKAKNEVLLTGSLIFYAVGDVRYLPLLMMSVLINYFFGLHLESGVSAAQTDTTRKGTGPGGSAGQSDIAGNVRQSDNARTAGQSGEIRMDMTFGENGRKSGAAGNARRSESDGTAGQSGGIRTDMTFGRDGRKSGNAGNAKQSGTAGNARQSDSAGNTKQSAAAGNAKQSGAVRTDMTFERSTRQTGTARTGTAAGGAVRQPDAARAEAGSGQRQKSKRNDTDQRLRKRHRLLLIAAVSFNVGVLAAFKYFIKGSLPLGISFYTFQILSYLIDVYQGEQEGETSFVNFATYVIMFPQMVSGPIVRYEEVRPALNKRKFTARSIQDGLKVFIVGLAAKVLLADTIGLLWRDAGMVGFESISTQFAWMAAIAYSLMLYFDFCGYSLMAIGLGRMLGFELPVNFQTPYMSTTVRDFYRRWHMTLGRWFTKYIYIPLGGNRKGAFRTVCNLLAVWILTAVWHGSTMNFLIWGMILWFAIVFERQMDSLGLLKMLEKGPGRLISHLYLWVVIPVSWMCFAISDVQELQIYLGRMFGLVPGIMVSQGDWLRELKAYWWLLLAGLAACTPLVMKVFKRFKDTLPGGIILVLVFWLCVRRLQMAGQNPFLYRDF